MGFRVRDILIISKTRFEPQTANPHYRWQTHNRCATWPHYEGNGCGCWKERKRRERGEKFTKSKVKATFPSTLVLPVKVNIAKLSRARDHHTLSFWYWKPLHYDSCCRFPISCNSLSLLLKKIWPLISYLLYQAATALSLDSTRNCTWPSLKLFR